MNNLQWVAVVMMMLPLSIVFLFSRKFYDPKKSPVIHLLSNIVVSISYGLVAICAFVVILLGA